MSTCSNTSYNHHFLIEMPVIGALSSSSSISSSFQEYHFNDDNVNNDPLGAQQLQAAAAAFQQPDPVANVDANVDAPPPPLIDPLQQPQQQRQYRPNAFWSRLVLAVALYLCPTFIIKPETPLRFRMTLPIILHLLIAFAILILVLLTILLVVLDGPVSPVNIFFPS